MNVKESEGKQMSISSSLAHKYDEFDEFSQQSAPKSAYEELKAWCEKYLPKDNYAETDVSNGPALWVGDTFFKFSSDGSFSFLD